jgi:hypothetical protein
MWCLETACRLMQFSVWYDISTIVYTRIASPPACFGAACAVNDVQASN